MRSMEQALGTVRPATPDDAAAFVDVHYKTWLATYPPIVEGLTEEMIKKRFKFDPINGFEKQVQIAKSRIENPRPNTQVFIHESPDTGGIDGLIVAGENEDHAKEIRALYVDPEVQGKGAGGQLMQTALEYMHAEINPVFLEVAIKNDQAIRFYEKHGFVKLREVPEVEVRPHLKEDDIYIPEMVMVREPASL